MFLEYSGNITSGLLKFAKDQHLLLSNHTLLTQTQLFHRELFKKYFSSKCSLNVPCLNVPNIAALGEHSANIPGILHAGWEEASIFTFYSCSL